VTSSWKNVALGDLIDIKHGYAFQGEFFSPEGPGDILMTPGNFAIGGGFQWGKQKYYNGPVPFEYVLQPGDLIVTMTDLSKEADTLGYSAIVPTSRERLLHNQRIGKVVTRNGAVSLPFLNWLMRTKSYRNEVLANVTGSTVKHTSPKKILSFQFLLPPPQEQKVIASTLDTLNNKIELNLQMNETLEAMARAVFKDWFVDFGPTRAKMEGRAPYLAPKIWSLFPDRLDDEGKPQGWLEKPLSDFFEIVGGGTPKTSVEAYWNGDIPWFSVVDTPPNGNLFVFNTEKAITKLGLAESAACLVPAGTTIISARGTVGNLAIAAQDMTFNQSCYALRSKGAVGDIFVFLAAQNMVARLQAMAHGSVFSTITRSTFEAITSPMPTEALLEEFEEAAKPLLAKIKANVNESRTLAATRDLLLPKLMSGEISVREADKFSELAAP
jgi:type I restriction enzyme S subunit